MSTKIPTGIGAEFIYRRNRAEFTANVPHVGVICIGTDDGFNAYTTKDPSTGVVELVPFGAASPSDGPDAIFVSPTGSDVTGDGTLANPYQTLPHAFDRLPFNRRGVTIKMLAGVYPPCDRGLVTTAFGGVSLGPPDFGFPVVSIEGETTDVLLFVTSADSDPLGVTLDTGVPAAVNAYRGPVFEILDCPADPSLNGYATRVGESDAAGVIRLAGDPLGTIIPALTKCRLRVAASVQPIAPGFALIPTTFLDVSDAIQWKYDTGFYFEIYGQGWVLNRAEIQVQPGSFAGCGVFQCDYALDGCWFRGDPTTFSVIGGNPFDWDRQLTFRGSVVDDLFVYHAPGLVASSWSFYLRSEVYCENATFMSSNDVRRGDGTTNQGVTVSVGSRALILNDAGPLSEWSGFKESAVAIIRNGVCTSVDLAGVNEPGAVGVKVANGSYTELGTATVTGGVGDVAVGGGVYTHGDIAAGGVVNLATNSNAMPDV